MSKCISPIHLKKEQIFVPCSKCLPCMKNRASSWSFRLMQEGKRCESAYFITFTYNTDTVPITPNGFMTLHKKDFQDFMKRLRKQSKPGLKYYCVGEYGGNFHRPHYHAIMFNLDLAVLIGEEMANQFQKGVIPMDGKHPVLSEIWTAGHVTIGKVTDASIGYTLIYISKGGEVPKHKRDDRQKEFSIMSKYIGSNYISNSTKEETITYTNKKGTVITRKIKRPVIDSKMKKWHHADLLNRYYVNIPTSKGLAKAPMPRYYKNNLYTDYQKNRIARHLEKQELEKWNKLSNQQKEDYYKQEFSRAQRLQYQKDNKK